MKTRLSCVFVLIASLALIWSTSGTAAQMPTPAPPSHQWQGAEGVTAQDHAQNVQLMGQTGGATHAVALQGNYAYIGVGPRLVILDISDPTQPTLSGQSPPLPETVERIKVSGGLAYIADGDSGIYIFDISDPAAPSQLGHYDTDGTAYDLAVEGIYAYVADGGDGLKIIDISNPAAPSQVGNIDTPSTAYGVAVRGIYVYVAAYYSEIRIINVQDPQHPIEIGHYDDVSWPVKITLDWRLCLCGRHQLADHPGHHRSCEP